MPHAHYTHGMYMFHCHYITLAWLTDIVKCADGPDVGNDTYKFSCRMTQLLEIRCEHL